MTDGQKERERGREDAALMKKEDKNLIHLHLHLQIMGISKATC